MINHHKPNSWFTYACHATNNIIKTGAYVQSWTKLNTFKVWMRKSGFLSAAAATYEMNHHGKSRFTCLLTVSPKSTFWLDGS